jgi:hypothetical protein
MLNRKKNHRFCKCISMDFGNDLQFLQMDFKFLEMHFQEFCKWIFNFGKLISKILEMDFQFLEMHFQDFGNGFSIFGNRFPIW